MKRSLGFKYESTEADLHCIDSFFIEQGFSEKCISKELSDIWCKKRSYETISNQAHRISNLRIFCKYLNDVVFNAYITPKYIGAKKHKYVPHIYTDDELKRFFVAVDESKSVPSECPYRGEVMPIFFRILYTSGMRVSELRLVKLNDVNTNNAIITVHEAKNQKERLVPIYQEMPTTKRKHSSDII